MRVLATAFLSAMLCIALIGPGVALADPEGSWADAGSMTAPRFFTTATLLPNGTVLVAGGQDGQGGISDVRVYDPAANSWTAASPLANARSRHSATLLDDGSVLVAGGLSRTPNSAPVLASTTIYDPQTGDWTPGPSMPLTRYLHTATKLGDHRVLLVGGFGGDDMTGQSSYGQATAVIFDPGTGVWTRAADSGSYRWGHVAALLPNGKVLVAGGEGSPVVGGCGPNCSQGLTTAELYDPIADAWSALPDLSAPRAYATATLLNDGRVLVAGGQSEYDPDVGQRVPTASSLLFDPATNSWSPAASMGTARYEHVAVLLSDGRVLVAGGFDPNYGGIKTAEIYDPATDTWSAAADMISTRWFPSAVLLPDDTVLVAGGAGGPSFSYLDTSERLTLPAKPPTAPGAPIGVTAIAGTGEATVSWLAPAADGGSAVTTYTVTASPGGASATSAGNSTTATVGGLTGGTPYTFTVAATNAVGTGPASLASASVTPTGPPPPDPFVKAVGTHLELEGQPFTFTGMNIYNANSDDWCANNMDHGVFEQALTDIDLGGVHGGDHGVIRAWFFEPLATAGLTGNRDWTRFDRTIAAAKAAGYYVIPTLGNQWGECGHKGPTAPYKTLAWYQTGYAQLQPEDSVYGAGYLPYRDWVAQVVARYKDEPAILAWQLLNEAETNADHPTGCPAGPAAYDAMAPWAANVSGLIKSIDPNHLVSLGTIGTGQCGTSGSQYKALHAIPTIDLCEYHDYDPWTAMPGDQFNGMALRIQQCGELNKPLFVGEVGLRPVDVGGSYDSRTASLRAKLIAQRAAGIVGHVVWSWGPAPRSLNGYDIGPGDDVPALLASGPTFATPTTPVDDDWVAPTITLTRPNRSLYTLNEPLTASFSCAEVGSSGLATCAGTLANGAAIDTTTPGHFTFTVDTTDNIGNHRSVSQTYDVTAGDVTTKVPPGPATVSTDPGNIGASAAVPVQTSVAFTAPGGPPTPVAIDMHPANIPAPSGYAILGNEVDIDLGGVTRPADDPIVITFVVDSSTGANPATITVSRTNADATTDIALACDALPAASPEPCFTAAFVAGAGSDVRVIVRTTHASKWLALRRTDTTPPIVTSSVSGSQGLNGWYRGNVAVSWTKTDAQSGILTSTGCGPTTISTDTAATTLTCSATSAGGTTTKSVTVKRDATPPTLTCSGGPFLLNAQNAKVGVTVTDAMSGPVVGSVFVNADTSSAGRKSALLAGIDKAGNIATTTCSYVVGYSLTITKPANNAIVKRGTTIGVEFKLKDAAGKVISDNAARTIANACGAKILFSGGNPSPNCARYDAGSDTFLFDLKTSKTMTPAKYVMTVQVLAGAEVVTTATVTVDIRT